MGHHLSYRGEETFLNQSSLSLNLVKRNLSQFVTFENRGLLNLLQMNCNCYSFHKNFKKLNVPKTRFLRK